MRGFTTYSAYLKLDKPFVFVFLSRPRNVHSLIPRQYFNLAFINQGKNLNLRGLVYKSIHSSI